MSRDVLAERLRWLADRLGADIASPRRQRQIESWLDDFGHHADDAIRRAAAKILATCEREWPRHDQMRDALREAASVSGPRQVDPDSCAQCQGRGLYSQPTGPLDMYAGRPGQDRVLRCGCAAGDQYPGVPK